MITLRTIGPVQTIEQANNALQDLYLAYRQSIALLNQLAGQGSAGQYVFPVVDDTGSVASYRLVAGAGVTLVVDSAAKTITVSSP